MLTAKNFSELIGLENFMSLLNYFSSKIKYRLCEVMVDYFIREEQPLSDDYKIHTVLNISKAVHDQIDSMSDEK